MLYGIFSDIHGNLPALEAVLRSMDSRKVEKRICLGDIVGYGASPNECAELVKQNSDFCLLGNHDSAALKRESYADFNIYAKTAIEWTQTVLSDSTKEYLKSRPYIIEEGNFTYVHASPVSPANWNYVTDIEGAIETFSFFSSAFCLIGHTHNPVIVATTEEKKNEIPIISDGPLYRPQKDERVLINVGSVGQPRDRDPRACWCLMDSEGSWIELVRVEYDISAAQIAMQKKNLPLFLIERLSLGR